MVRRKGTNKNFDSNNKLQIYKKELEQSDKRYVEERSHLRISCRQ